METNVQERVQNQQYHEAKLVLNTKLFLGYFEDHILEFMNRIKIASLTAQYKNKK